MARRMTTEEFIEKAREIHGDKYDYSEVRYKNNKTKVKIKCNQCNNFFWQTPNSHLSGHGCPKCGIEKSRDNLRLTTKEFIEKARMIHKDKYDYSEVKYKNAFTKVKIICPEHGEFWQTPHDHLNGHGCPKCAGSARLTTEEFIKRAREIHGNRYDYSEVEYKNTSTKVKIKCNQCNNFFWQTPNSHLKGHGCPKCGLERARQVSDDIRLTTEEFIEKARMIHKDKYDYSEVKYKNSRTRVKIICPEHGSFWQRPDDHLSGKGCPKCANPSFDFDKPAILYYIKICHEDRIYYKIGITNKTVETRFYPKDLRKIEIIKTWEFKKGEDAYEKEQEILEKYREYRYNGNEKILESGGNTELFTKDILNLDNVIFQWLARSPLVEDNNYSQYGN